MEYKKPSIWNVKFCSKNDIVASKILQSRSLLRYFCLINIISFSNLRQKSQGLSIFDSSSNVSIQISIFRLLLNRLSPQSHRNNSTLTLVTLWRQQLAIAHYTTTKTTSIAASLYQRPFSNSQLLCFSTRHTVPGRLTNSRTKKSACSS